MQTVLIVLMVTNAGYHLYLDNNKARFDLSNHESTVSQNSIGSNSWTFLVGLIDNGSIKLYVNGILESTSTSTAHLSPINLMIGKIQDNRSSYWNGKIDDVRIYNRALSDSEIQELYQEGSNAITLTLTPPTTTTVSQGSKLGPFSISIKNNTSSSYTSYVYIYLVSPDETWKTLISKSLTFQPARHLPLITCTRISHPLYRRDHTIIG
ncbi:MAG: LamG domain-containing protein [Nitrospirae bacterium]|nr:LamG domain-containing protein [Nitrospirota bacterium]